MHRVELCMYHIVIHHEMTYMRVYMTLCDCRWHSMCIPHVDRRLLQVACKLLRVHPVMPSKEMGYIGLACA